MFYLNPSITNNGLAPFMNIQLKGKKRPKLDIKIWNGETIYLLDFKKYRDNGKCLHLIKQLADEVAGKDQFVRVLIDGRDMYYSKVFINEAKAISKHVFDKVTGKAAIIGVTPMQEVILKGYNMVVKNKLASFKTQQEAFNFLMRPVPQKSPTLGKQGSRHYP